MDIIDLLIVPWQNDEIAEVVITITAFLFLIALLPVLYFIFNRNSRICERTFNQYMTYVGAGFISVFSMEIFFWPISLLLNSLFLLGLLDKESAKAACYREKNGIGFRFYEVRDKTYYDKSVQYSKEQLKKYLPNPIVYCLLLYLFPLVVVGLCFLFDLGYVFWI